MKRNWRRYKPDFLPDGKSVADIRANHAENREHLKARRHWEVNPYTFAVVGRLLAEIDRLAGCGR